MMNKKDQREACSVRCPHCEAVTPNFCRTPQGRRAVTHVKRYEHYLWYYSTSKLGIRLRKIDRFKKLYESILRFRG